MKFLKGWSVSLCHWLPINWVWKRRAPSKFRILTWSSLGCDFVSDCTALSFLFVEVMLWIDSSRIGNEEGESEEEASVVSEGR